MGPRTTRVTTWEDFIANEETRPYPIAPIQLSALKTFFSDPTVAVAEIAQQICTPILEVLKQPQDVRNQYSYSLLWRSIADAIRCLPEFNDKFVDLVVAVSKVDDPTGFIPFMQDFRQMWNEFVFNFKDPPSTDPDREAKRKAWYNLNCFSAKLSTYNVARLDERPYAASVLRQTLEHSPWLTFHHADLDADDDPTDRDYKAWKAHELELRDVRVLNAYVPAAAVWFTFNARGLWEMRGEMGDEYEHNRTDWEGKRGWSRERWRFWRGRFEWISEVTVLERVTREAAREAAEIMKRFEEDDPEKAEI